MTQNTGPSSSDPRPMRPAQLREARLKAALKANMARRKAQAKERGTARAAPDDATQTRPDHSTGPEQE